MLHPITCEVLSEGDQYERAVQREAFQLRNRLTAAGVKCPSLVVRWVNALGVLLIAIGARLKVWKIPPSSQVPGEARG